MVILLKVETIFEIYPSIIFCRKFTIIAKLIFIQLLITVIFTDIAERENLVIDILIFIL